MTDRVLVTGATGLIGPYVVSALTGAGREVVTAGRRDPGIGNRHLVVDLLDKASRDRMIRQADASHLVHLAWHDDVRDRWTSAANLDWAAATVSLIREFAEVGGKRAVCAGSCAEYDWSQAVLSEDTPLKPGSVYGKAKAATGTLLTGTSADIGLSLAWARVFFCYGPNEPEGRLLGDLISGLREGRRVPCTDGLQERDFLHVADVGRAIAAVMGAELEGAVNIGSGIPTPVRDIIVTVAGILGRPDLVELGARPRPAGDPARLVADVSRLASTGFEPSFDLRSGLADCVAAFEAQQVAGGAA